MTLLHLTDAYAGLLQQDKRAGAKRADFIAGLALTSTALLVNDR